VPLAAAAHNGRWRRRFPRGSPPLAAAGNSPAGVAAWSQGTPFEAGRPTRGSLPPRREEMGEW